MVVLVLWSHHVLVLTNFDHLMASLVPQIPPRSPIAVSFSRYLQFSRTGRKTPSNNAFPIGRPEVLYLVCLVYMQANAAGVLATLIEQPP